MDWTGLGLREHVIDWLEAAATPRHVKERRLDPFATSMRDFDDASAHIKAIREGNPPGVNDAGQRITDLKNAGLVEPSGQALTELGNVVLDAWEQYGVDSDAKTDEFARLLLMALEARRIGDGDFAAFFEYWSDLRAHFAPLELIDSWDVLYQLNYLDFERNGFAPGTLYRDEKVAVADVEFDLGDYARDTGASALAIKGGKRIEDAIGGKLPRGRHRATFCMALEIVLSEGQSAPEILKEFGFPKKPRVWSAFNETQREKISLILVNYGVGAGEEKEDLLPHAVEIIATQAASATPESALILPPDIDFSKVLVDPPKPKPKTVENGGIAAGPKKVDHKKKAEANDAVGNIGEQFAVDFERWRLRDHPDLLNKIRHVSQEDDTLGYDIDSFELDGTSRFVEVKATLGPMETRFFLTKTEVECAEEKGAQYVVLRVAQLATDPQCCEIRYPFDGKLDLSPSAYSVTFVSDEHLST